MQDVAPGHGVNHAGGEDAYPEGFLGWRHGRRFGFRDIGWGQTYTWLEYVTEDEPEHNRQQTEYKEEHKGPQGHRAELASGSGRPGASDADHKCRKD